MSGRRALLSGAPPAASVSAVGHQGARWALEACAQRDLAVHRSSRRPCLTPGCRPNGLKVLAKKILAQLGLPEDVEGYDGSVRRRHLRPRMTR
jgi:hypothetical protein